MTDGPERIWMAGDVEYVRIDIHKAALHEAREEALEEALEIATRFGRMPTALQGTAEWNWRTYFGANNSIDIVLEGGIGPEASLIADGIRATEWHWRTYEASLIADGIRALKDKP